MEILKRLFPQKQCNEFFSSLFRVSYGVGMVLAPILGLLCDTYLLSLKWLFTIGAFFHLFSALLYIFIRPSTISTEVEPVPKIGSFLLDPWKHSYQILRENALFRRFQVGFFIAGSGLMIAKPAGEVLLSKLHLPYLLIFICRTLLKGSGTIGSSKIWSKHLSQKSVLSISSLVAVGFLLSQLFLLSSLTLYYLVFFAYAIYGIAQGGSQLIWHLSGPMLSGEESSCQYSSVNILAVGVRGAIAPLLGGILLHSFGIIPTMWISSFTIFLGALYLQKQKEPVFAKL
jgi:predicted MFS family arabinose efflux permease